ncbi:phage major capsid protein [Chloroflexi bacterium CFX6]|nr:phage major capsid protein [Chloroflexi bacterium CFX6]
MNERELLARRAQLITQARAMFEAADAEHRDFTAEEQTNYDAIFDDVAKIDRKIENLRRLGTADDAVPNAEPERPGSERGGATPQEEAVTRAFEAFLRRGAITPELRALQADSDASGGFYTSPQQFVNRLIQSVDDQVFIRQWATPNTVTQAQSLGVPTLAADPADADWTSELGTGNEDTAMSFGKRELHPYPLAKRIKVSNKLLRLSPDVEALVIQRLAYKFAVAYEKAGMTGSGANQPLGVFTASADGISTGRDVSTDNTTTAFTTDGIKNAKYALKAAYWPRAKWVFHRDGVKMLAKLKDAENRYLWQNSIQIGQPDMLEGIPLFTSEYSPNTFTASQYVGILGDFSFYWTADALDFSIQRLNELYAATNQTGFIGRLESDGMPVLEEAFVRVKLAAS